MNAARRVVVIMAQSADLSFLSLHADNMACVRAAWSQCKQDSPAVNSPPSDQDRWFEEEVQPHEPALRAFLRQRFPAIHDVDDLVQESYARLLEARRKSPIANARAYLFTTARNAALSQLRRPQIFAEQPLDDFSTEAVIEDRANVINLVTTRQETAVLLAAVESLPARCREVFILTKLQGCSHQEAADRLGLSVQTVHVQVSRGIQKCTLFLRERGVVGPNPS